MNTEANVVFNGNMVKVANHYTGYDKGRGLWAVFTNEHKYVIAHPTLEQAVKWMKTK